MKEVGSFVTFVTTFVSDPALGLSRSKGILYSVCVLVKPLAVVGSGLRILDYTLVCCYM
jgi:hypothetical protein